MPSRQSQRRRKPGTKPLNLKKFSAARLRSLLRRINNEIDTLHSRIVTIPAQQFGAERNLELEALHFQALQAKALLVLLDKHLVRFTEAHPRLGALPAKPSCGPQMVGYRNVH